MSLTIQIESPLTQDAHRLIDGSETALRAVYTVDECFTFTAQELDKPDVTFLVARANNAAIGCIALVDCDGYAEVKRLFVTPEARGTGAARALMSHIEDLAIQQGHNQIKLETGEKLAAAVALYRSLGFEICGPFGEYEDHPASLFMSKPLA